MRAVFGLRTSGAHGVTRPTFAPALGVWRLLLSRCCLLHLKEFSDNITGRFCACTPETYCEDSLMAGQITDNLLRLMLKFFSWSENDWHLLELGQTGSA